MEKKLNCNSTFVQRLFSKGESIPGIPLVFLTVAIVSALQIPANLIIRSVSFNFGILLNEFVFIAAIPLTVVLLLKFERRAVFPMTPPRFMWVLKAFFLTLPAAMLIDYAAGFTDMVFPIPDEYYAVMKQVMSFSGTYGFMFKLVLLCFVPGICEEIFFRGFCQSSLKRKWGDKKAILITALIFAVLHGNPWYIHLYFALGLFLGWIYSAAKTLWAPIICHILNNAWTFVNNALEIKYPLHGFGHPLDITFILLAVLTVAMLAININRHST